MPLPKRLRVHRSEFYFDGGTVLLPCTDEAEQSHVVMLVQSLFPNGRTFGIPGRLYFDDEAVPVRSEVEAQLLALLRVAEVRYIPRPGAAGQRIEPSPNRLILGEDIKEVLAPCEPEEHLQKPLARLIQSVESPKYVTFAAEVDQ